MNAVILLLCGGASLANRCERHLERRHAKRERASGKGGAQLLRAWEPDSGLTMERSTIWARAFGPHFPEPWAVPNAS